MAVQDANENRMLDALLTKLQKIGTPSTSWLTTPGSALIGIPNDAVNNTTKAQPFLRLQYLSTEERDDSADTTTHVGRAHFAVWCVSTDSSQTGMREVIALKADVLRALFAAEGTLFASWAYGCWPDEFFIHEEMLKAGVWAGVQRIHIDFPITHAAP